MERGIARKLKQEVIKTVAPKNFPAQIYNIVMLRVHLKIAKLNKGIQFQWNTCTYSKVVNPLSTNIHF